MAQKKSLFASMDDSQKKQAKNAKSKEELNGVLKSGERSLSDDQLDAVSGGAYGEYPRRTIADHLAGDARNGIDPELADRSLSEGRLTGAAFFA